MKAIFGRLFRFEWDSVKAQSNLEKHGVAFEDVEHFEFESSETVEDNRQDYGEDRYVSLGLIGRRLHALVFTMRNLDLKTATLRVISLRKANNEEIDQYEQAKSQPDDDARH
jgi:uncharacterized DUF497 family protein